MIKKYVLLSQGYPIHQTPDKDEATKMVEDDNKEYLEYVEKCINEWEPYADTSLSMVEQEMTQDDVINLYKEKNNNYAGLRKALSKMSELAEAFEGMGYDVSAQEVKSMIKEIEEEFIWVNIELGQKMINNKTLTKQQKDKQETKWQNKQEKHREVNNVREN